MRIVYVLVMRDRPVIGDGAYYHLSAIFLAEGHGYVNVLASFRAGTDVPSALHPPAWTTVLAVPSALGFRSFLAHQLVACAVGAATIVMTGVAGRVRVRSPDRHRRGRAGRGLSECLDLRKGGGGGDPRTARRGDHDLARVPFPCRPGVTGAALLGPAVGALTMTRPELISLALFLILPLVLVASGEWRQRIAWLAAAGIACAVVIAPWGSTTRHASNGRFHSRRVTAARCAGKLRADLPRELLGYYSSRASAPRQVLFE